jgi:hypothetical protein
MITQEQAERIATEITGRGPESGGWELVEFDAGWLIRESSASDASLRGGALRVVERESGRVMRFPSGVPPQRIVAEYAEVVERSRVEYPPDLSDR